MKVPAEGWDAHVSAMLAEACTAAQKGDTFFGCFVISTIIEKLKTGESLSPPLSEYLAKVLGECLADPANAGKALNLLAPTIGRPKGSHGLRDFEIKFDVYFALSSGQPLRGNSNGQDGAIAAVANKHNVSEGTVDGVWKASRKALKAVGEFAIDLSCEPPKVPPVRKIKVEK